MRLLCSLSPFLFALSFGLAPALASADEPSLAEWAQHHVEEVLLKPLAVNEAHVSRFSRMRPRPHQRRVRVTQTEAARDKSGRTFVRFSIDVKYGAEEWREDDIVGCTYTGKGELYVKRSDGYRPVAFLFGKDQEPVAGVCEVATGS